MMMIRLKRLGKPSLLIKHRHHRCLVRHIAGKHAQVAPDSFCSHDSFTSELLTSYDTFLDRDSSSRRAAPRPASNFAVSKPRPPIAMNVPPVKSAVATVGTISAPRPFSSVQASAASSYCFTRVLLHQALVILVSHPELAVPHAQLR